MPGRSAVAHRFTDYLQSGGHCHADRAALGLRDGLWHRVRQAAYLESDTPHGRPFTGRRYSNDEVYRSGCRQRELRHGKKTVEGIVHYVRMRHDSARVQLKRLRRAIPRAADRFATTAEELPRAA
jgi:hypothetical protein